MSKRFVRSNSLASLAFAVLAGGVGVHCAASDSADTIVERTPGSPTVEAGKEGGFEEPEGTGALNDRPDGGAGPLSPPVPPLNVPSNGVLLVNAHATFPAFRLCPAVLGDGGPPSSSASFQPIPTTLMPRSSLAGVDVRGAVRIDPSPDFASVKSVVLIKIDDNTKDNPSLARASCAALACTGPAPCVGAQNLKLVTLDDPGLLAKAGTVLVLTGDSDANVRFVTRTALASPKSPAGHFQVQLFNESKFDGGVAYSTGKDGGTSSIPANSANPTELTYDGFAGALVAGTHLETLLAVHESSDPRVPITEHYASPGVFALVLVGSTGAASERPLKFLAVPMHR